MLIKSKIERAKGTRVTLDGINYHFAPTKPGGAHIASVSNTAHIARLLGIAEGFTVYDEQQDEEQRDIAASVAPLAGLGADADNDTDNMSQFETSKAPTDDPAIAAATKSQAADASNSAHDAMASNSAAQSSVTQVAAGSASAAAALAASSETNTAASSPAATSQQASKPMTEDDEAQLRAEYAELNGRAAPPNTKPETLAERVAELKAAKAAE